MTVISNIKGTLAAAKGIEAEFSRFAQLAADKNSQAIFHECMLETGEVVRDLELRAEHMKAEELQYRNT